MRVIISFFYGNTQISNIFRSYEFIHQIIKFFSIRTSKCS